MRPRTFAAAILISFTVGCFVGGYSVSSRSRSAAENVVPERESTNSNIVQARVIQVIDGDTVSVRFGGDNVPIDRVRLAAVDTPERGQDGFDEATALLRSMVEGRTVTLIATGSSGFRRDRYGRVIALVEAGDMQVNTRIVRAGWSAFVDRDDAIAWRLALIEAEEEARASKRGIWRNR